MSSLENAATAAALPSDPRMATLPTGNLPMPALPDLAMPPRGQKLAYNIRLECFDDKLKDDGDRPDKEILVVSGFHGDRYSHSEIRDVVRNEWHKHEDSWRLPTPAEKDLTTSDPQNHCYWVGWFLPCLYERKKPPGRSGKERRPRGQCVSNCTTSPLVFGQDVTKAYKAVYKSNQRTGVLMPYALHSPDENGICVATMVPGGARNVFFFPEWRDDRTTDTVKRQRVWLKKIRLGILEKLGENPGSALGFDSHASLEDDMQYMSSSEEESEYDVSDPSYMDDNGTRYENQYAGDRGAPLAPPASDNPTELPANRFGGFSVGRAHERLNRRTTVHNTRFDTSNGSIPRPKPTTSAANTGGTPLNEKRPLDREAHPRPGSIRKKQRQAQDDNLRNRYGPPKTKTTTQVKVEPADDDDDEVQFVSETRRCETGHITENATSRGASNVSAYNGIKYILKFIEANGLLMVAADPDAFVPESMLDLFSKHLESTDWTGLDGLVARIINSDNKDFRVMAAEALMERIKNWMAGRGGGKSG